MTTLLDPTNSRSGHPEMTGMTPARRLRTTMAACRVQFTWFGTRKSLTREQKARAAETFDADAPYLSASKRLIDTQHPAFRAVTAIRTKMTDTWRGQSLPFPEPGVRLIKLEAIEAFDRQMADFRAELEDSVVHLDRHYGELKRVARNRLGSLFHDGDYPETLTGLFGVAWDFPNFEPPDYLVQLSPDLYRQEQERARARFDEAVELAEQSFLQEFAHLVEHLTGRLAGTDEDGQPRVFRDSAVANLDEFFQRFRSLNVRSNPQLDELVERAQRVVRGVGPQDLRDQDALRRSVAAQLGRVQAELDGLMIERPRRRILRQARATEVA